MLRLLPESGLEGPTAQLLSNFRVKRGQAVAEIVYHLFEVIGIGIRIDAQRNVSARKNVSQPIAHRVRREGLDSGLHLDVHIHRAQVFPAELPRKSVLVHTSLLAIECEPHEVNIDLESAVPESCLKFSPRGCALCYEHAHEGNACHQHVARERQNRADARACLCEDHSGILAYGMAARQ